MDEITTLKWLHKNVEYFKTNKINRVFTINNLSKKAEKSA